MIRDTIPSLKYFERKKILKKLVTRSQMARRQQCERKKMNNYWIITNYFNFDSTGICIYRMIIPFSTQHILDTLWWYKVTMINVLGGRMKSWWKKMWIKAWKRIENKQINKIKKAEIFVLFTKIIIDKRTLIKAFVARQSVI